MALSIKLRLPLLIVALLGVVIGGFGWSAYRQMSRAFERSAEIRLERASERLAAMLGQSVVQMRTRVVKAAADSAVTSAVRQPNPANRLAASRAFAAAITVSDPVSRALWSRRCELLAAAGHVAFASRDCPASPVRSRTLVRTSGAGPAVQSFAPRGDSVAYEVVAPVLGDARDTLGYLVDTRMLRTGESAKAIGGLIGSDVQVMLGNASGLFWTDLSHRVQGPAVLPPRGTVVAYENGGHERMIGVARDVPLSPWTVWVELPHRVVVAPALATLRDLAAIALACLLIGALGAWRVSRYVTAPLRELAGAAQGLAAGDYSRRVAEDRSDELGVLIGSFNRMAEKVESSTEELTTQAMELELHVHESQNLANELEISNQELSEAFEQATAARRDSTIAESLLDEVLAQAPVGIAVFDRQMRYVRINQAVADIHGVPVAEHIGKRPSEVLPALGAMKEPLLERVFRTGERVLEQRLSGILPDGTSRHWLSSCFPIRGPEGVITGAGAMLVDNTAEHELQAQFLQAQKMEAVGRLAGGIAHDFNNLLTVITSYGSLALDTLRVDDPLHRDIVEIQRAAERAAGLTRQLLAFSRKQVMRPQLLDLNQMASDMERMLQRLIGEDMTLELVLAPDLGAVSADPGQVEQVIMNLVVNARDAMPSGGRVTIETANVPSSSETPTAGDSTGGFVLLTVTDTGTGMSEETQKNLFEPFFTTKGAGLGTGLGLSTAYGIVTQSGGDIKVQSELGRGTTFRIYLPRVRSELQPASRQTPTGTSTLGGSETILLVEDDEPLRNLAGRVLRDAGYTVLDTRTPTDAVMTGTHHAGNIDLLLTDVVMPEMSGRTVAELLSHERPAIRVLYMSGYTDDDVVRRGVLTTETQFLQKPFTPAQLLKQVRETLDGTARARII